MSQVDEEWTSNSNDATSISLVTVNDLGLRVIERFKPVITIALFGQEEQIFGYQGLKIDIRYHASDMRPNVLISWQKQFQSRSADTEPTDVRGLLKEYLPEVAFQKDSEFRSAVKQVPVEWSPPGTLAGAFSRGDTNFEIWKGTLDDEAIKQTVLRIQFLVSVLIDGGLPIDVNGPDANRWTVYLLYRKQSSEGEPGQHSYTFAGYCTVYRFFLYQSPSITSGNPTKDELDFGDGTYPLSDLPCRSRISQFIILPPFQGKGVGQGLYEFLYEQYLHHEQTVEITVEDPNEAFDDVRDVADLTYLHANSPEFTAIRINPSVKIAKPRAGPAPQNIIDRAAAEALRRKYKIAPRQFSRLLELELMSKLPKSVRPTMAVDQPRRGTRDEEHEYQLWRLFMKQRLYRHNKDVLGQLELPERIDKLNEAADSMQWDYARILEKLARKKEANSAAASAKKRTLEDGDPAPASKKARVDEE